jgi:hypothetical protein
VASFRLVIISLALLGYGASGTVIALARSWLEARFEQALAVTALLFSVAMVLCLVLGQRVPFNALEVIWDPVQLVWLAQLYLLFMLPFLFAGGCIGLAFACRGERADRIYFSDLLGAGLGAALAIAVLFLLPPQQAVVVFAGLALAASALAMIRAATQGPTRAGSGDRSGDASGDGSGRRPHRPVPRILASLQLAWLTCLVFVGAGDRVELRMSEFKA